jgi:acyl-CoA reductase-like NAD-dependent aldehyde dehydrogenase
MEEQLLLIDGERVPSQSGLTFASLDPSSESEITRVSAASAVDVDRACLAARRAFDDGPWTKMPIAARAGMLSHLASLIKRDAAEFAELEARDAGKPISVAAVADVPATIGWFYQAASWASTATGQTLTPVSQPDQSKTMLAYTVREPIGVIGQIIPWNYPLLFCAWKLAPALAFGNTVVLKPAEQTPLSALKLGALFQEAGFPPGVVNIVPGVGATPGTALCRNPNVDKLAFTGSTEVGKLVARSAIEDLKRVSLELGGKSPFIIFDDANVDAAIECAADAIFYNQGEVCGAGSRLFVQRKVYDRVVAGLAAIAAKLKVGAGTDPATEMGPMITAAHRDRVCSYIEKGIAQGAKLVEGGTKHHGKGYFVKPTVFADCDAKMSIASEEIFGPVVSVTPFDDEDDVVAKANDTIYGLAAGIWTQDIGKAHRTARRVRAGTVWINTYHVYDPVLPFGGFKQSGWGREHGSEAVKLYTELKTVIAAL